MILNYRKVLDTIPQVGTLKWIGLRPSRKAKIMIVESAAVNMINGLTGDRHSSDSERMVTLIQAEHLPTMTSMLGGLKNITPQDLRRNLMISGINLLALKGKQFCIGEEVILEYTGPCHPCTRMEEILGPGGLNAMRGHGGICARVVQGGVIQVGDSVRVTHSKQQ
jgi:MOSC domain-containing protein YiiM